MYIGQATKVSSPPSGVQRIKRRAGWSTPMLLASLLVDFSPAVKVVLPSSAEVLLSLHQGEAADDGLTVSSAATAECCISRAPIIAAGNAVKLGVLIMAVS